MKIKLDRWVIVTKERPTLFPDYSGELQEDFSNAPLWFSQEEAKDRLADFDEPGRFSVIPVSITTEI